MGISWASYIMGFIDQLITRGHRLVVKIHSLVIDVFTVIRNKFENTNTNVLCVCVCLDMFLAPLLWKTVKEISPKRTQLFGYFVQHHSQRTHKFMLVLVYVVSIHEHWASRPLRYCKCLHLIPGVLSGQFCLSTSPIVGNKGYRFEDF